MRTIWTNGCFDVIHAGHIAMLSYARSLGDRLVVGIDSDVRVKQLKGSSRPINDQAARETVLRAIRCVDDVIIFNNAAELRQSVINCEASLIVVGDDYMGRDVIGADIVPVTFFKRLPGLSSTWVVDALRL